MINMKALIKNIKITERVRKKIAKIEELAADIKIHGLLNPITVMPIENDKYRLLAGLRRLRAIESMGLDEIDVNVVSPDSAELELRIEISENEQREPFTFSEKMDFARLLEEIEKAKAEKRMLSGKHMVDPVNHGTQGHGKVRDIVGSKIGMSGIQYDRAKYVAENASDQVKEQLDKGKRSIRGTYDELRSQEKADKKLTGVVNSIVPKISESEKSLNPKTVNISNIKSKLEKKSEKRSKSDDTKKSLTMPNIAGLLSEEDKAAMQRNKEFHAMPPLEKIKELQRQLRDERARAAYAESELARLKELHHNAVYHKDGVINNLQDRLAEAEARIMELETKSCCGIDM